MNGTALARRRSREKIEHRSWLREQRAALERDPVAHIPRHMVLTREALQHRKMGPEQVNHLRAYLLGRNDAQERDAFSLLRCLLVACCVVGAVMTIVALVRP